MTSSKEKGTVGENTAIAFLKNLGYRVIEKNFRSHGGEIDIIAIDRQELVFTEVKSWDAYPVEMLEYAIGQVKKRKIIRTARYFIMLNPHYSQNPMRFDILFLSQGATEITHIKNAFGIANG